MIKSHFIFLFLFSLVACGFKDRDVLQSHSTSNVAVSSSNHSRPPDFLLKTGCLSDAQYLHFKDGECHQYGCAYNRDSQSYYWRHYSRSESAACATIPVCSGQKISSRAFGSCVRSVYEFNPHTYKCEWVGKLEAPSNSCAHSEFDPPCYDSFFLENGKCFKFPSYTDHNNRCAYGDAEPVSQYRCEIEKTCTQNTILEIGGKCHRFKQVFDYRRNVCVWDDNGIAEGRECLGNAIPTDLEDNLIEFKVTTATYLKSFIQNSSELNNTDKCHLAAGTKFLGKLLSKEGSHGRVFVASRLPNCSDLLSYRNVQYIYMPHVSVP